MPYSRFVVLAIAIVGGLWLLGYLPTRRFAGDAAALAMLVGGALALIASLTGTLPLVWARGRPPAEKISAIMGSIALRTRGTAKL